MTAPAPADPPDHPIRVAIVNDDEIVVRGLAQMVGETGRVEIVEIDASEGVTASVDIALYDTFSRPQLVDDKVDALLADPQVAKVAIYTWNMDPKLVQIALDKGIDGYLSKSLTGERVVDALEAIHAGTVLVEPRADVGRADLPIVGGDWPGRRQGLTARESEIIALITQGLSNNEIAERAFLSINSVKSHIRGAYRVMGVQSRSQAVLWGIDHDFDPDRVRIRKQP